MENDWILIDSRTPISGERCLVTDGDIVVIATYILESNNSNIWIFNGLTDVDSKTFIVKYWQSLPKLPKKIIPYEETTPTEEIKTNNND